MPFRQAEASFREIQTVGQEVNQLTICPFFQGGCCEANFQGPIVESGNLVGGASRLNVDR